MEDPHPKIENLVKSLTDLNVGEFLKSKEFNRMLIRMDLSDYWHKQFKTVEKNRNYFSVGMDHKKYDLIDTLVCTFNELYQAKNNNSFFYFYHDILFNYLHWSEEDLDLKDITQDLKLISCPDKVISSINSFYLTSSNPVPKSQIPESTWNSERLKEYIDKMDSSIENEDFNLTLTYAYSCLEGLFKAFVVNNIPEKNEENDLSKLAKLVKDFIIEKFKESDDKYPEQMINLIGTITNAISNARNKFSDSHFDNKSDIWMAEFARDTTNSVGRLILKFIK